MAIHVVYLSYDGLTDPLGSSQVLPYILGIEKAGYRFTVISFEKPDRFIEGKENIHSILKEKNICWIPLIYHKFPPVFSTLWDIRLLTYNLKKLKAEDPFRFIHCRGYITALAGLEFKRKWGIPFIFDMRGFFADERADAGMWKKGHPVFGWVYRFFKSKEKEFLRESDYSVVLTHAGEKIIRSGLLTGSPEDIPLKVIPCCADMGFFNYSNVSIQQTHRLKKEIGAEAGTFILGYSGSVGTWYMLPEMLRFFKKILEEKADSIFLFLTRDNPSEILNMADEMGIPEQAIKIKSVTRKEMPAWLSVFTKSVFFILPSFSKQASSPTKQGELMGMGIPVICNSGVGDTEEIVKGGSAGIVINLLNDEELKQASIKCLYLSFDREQIRKKGIETYSLEAGVTSYLEIYSDLVLE